jgi:hypothetical protein
MNVMYVFVLRPRQAARDARLKKLQTQGESMDSIEQTPYGHATTATNGLTGKRYVISTAQSGIGGGWQTAVFKKRLGLFAGTFSPEFFVGGAETEPNARIQHKHVEAIVQSIEPAKWEEAKWALVSKIAKNELWDE